MMSQVQKRSKSSSQNHAGAIDPCERVCFLTKGGVTRGQRRRERHKRHPQSVVISDRFAASSLSYSVSRNTKLRALSKSRSPRFTGRVFREGRCGKKNATLCANHEKRVFDSVVVATKTFRRQHVVVGSISFVRRRRARERLYAVVVNALTVSKRRRSRPENPTRSRRYCR